MFCDPVMAALSQLNNLRSPSTDPDVGSQTLSVESVIGKIRVIISKCLLNENTVEKIQIIRLEIG